MEPNTDAAEVLETQQTEDQPEIGTTEPQETEAPQIDEEKEQLRRDKEELEKKNKQLFERLKKQPTSTSKDDLSNKDILYLAKADIHDEDMDDVVAQARLQKISVAEAHQFMKPILQERAEMRTTAAATNTRSGARGSAKTTPEEVLSKAHKGETFDTVEGMQAIFQARQNARKRSK